MEVGESESQETWDEANAANRCVGHCGRCGCRRQNHAGIDARGIPEGFARVQDGAAGLQQGGSEESTSEAAWRHTQAVWPPTAGRTEEAGVAWRSRVLARHAVQWKTGSFPEQAEMRGPGSLVRLDQGTRPAESPTPQVPNAPLAPSFPVPEGNHDFPLLPVGPTLSIGGPPRSD